MYLKKFKNMIKSDIIISLENIDNEIIVDTHKINYK